MAEIKTIQANGLEFAYFEAGTGPLVLCMHGFPDTAHTWLDLLSKLADTGYHAVAPFMRGYYPSAIPADGDYSTLALGQDILGLIDAFGAESAIVIGHDWGAMSAYSAVNQDTHNKISKLVTIAIPHPRTIRPNLRFLIKAWHFVFFQFRYFARRWMRKNDYGTIDYIFKWWSPDWQFTAEDSQPVKDAFKQTGRVDSALGYYWSFVPNPFDKQAKEAQRIVAKKISIPTLTFVGKNDGAVDWAVFNESHRGFTGDFELVVMEGAGHFLHREKPDDFGQKVLAFLQAD